MIYNQRIEKLKVEINKRGLDCVLIYGDNAVYYYTGFVPMLGHSLLIVTSQGEKKFFHQFMYDKHRILDQESYSEIISVQKYSSIVREHIIDYKSLGVIGFELIPYYFLMSFNDSKKISSLDDFITEERLIKSEDEIQNLRKACEVTEDAIQASIDYLKLGVSEERVAAFFEFYVRSAKCKLSFDSMVAFGERSRIVATNATNNILGENEGIVFDVGARYKKYCADIGRTFFFGSPPKKFETLYNKVLGVYEFILSYIKPGMVASDIHKKLLELYKENGLGVMRHRIGHGIGLETSLESPCFETNDIVLRENMTFAIEVSHEGYKGMGIKIEDNVVLREHGCELLNNMTRKLQIVV